MPHPEHMLAHTPATQYTTEPSSLGLMGPLTLIIIKTISHRRVTGQSDLESPSLRLSSGDSRWCQLDN